MRTVVIKTCCIFFILSSSLTLAAESNKILLLITPILSVPKPKTYVSSLFTATTAVTSHGLCSWNRFITGIATVELNGNVPFNGLFSFKGIDTSKPIPTVVAPCVGEEKSFAGTEQITIGVDRKIDVTVFFGDGTGRFAGEISEDLSEIIGTFTVNKTEFDYPAIGPLILTKR